MRHICIAAIVLLPALAGAAGHAQADMVSLIVNPDFDCVYAVGPAAAAKMAPDPAGQRMLPKFENRPQLPYGWKAEKRRKGTSLKRRKRGHH